MVALTFIQSAECISISQVGGVQKELDNYELLFIFSHFNIVNLAKLGYNAEGRLTAAGSTPPLSVRQTPGPSMMIYALPCSIRDVTTLALEPSPKLIQLKWPLSPTRSLF